MRPCILLADMNSFYASVHQAVNPTLRGQPVIVCGRVETRHGIVLASSYEAKKVGVKTGMTSREAECLLPQGIFIQPDFSLYLNFSWRILRVLKDFSPLVEPFSVDEAFIDVTDCQDLFGSGVEIARQIKQRIWDEIGIHCSIGVSTNKLLAKMAAERQKPDGLTLILPEEVPEKIWPLPVKELFGVGGGYTKKLNFMGIKTIGDLARYPVDTLQRRFGIPGLILHLSANGLDYSPVSPRALDQAKSMGHQITLPRDYRTHEEIRVVLLGLAEIVGYRVRRANYVGKTVSLTLKDADFQTSAWSMTRAEYTDLAEDIYDTAFHLLGRHWPPGRKVRLAGITLANLIPRYGEQADIDNRRLKLNDLARACDRIRDRFGQESITRAVLLPEEV